MVNVQAGLLLAVLLQLAFGEFLSRVFQREPSPFLACLVAFCLVHVSLRALLPTVMSPMAVTGRLERTQTYTVLALMFISAAAYAIVLPTSWIDVDVPLGARALKETGAFWRGVGGTFARMAEMVHTGSVRDVRDTAPVRQPDTAAGVVTGAAHDAGRQGLEGLDVVDGIGATMVRILLVLPDGVNHSIDCAAHLRHQRIAWVSFSGACG